MVTQGAMVYPFDNRMGVGIQDRLTQSSTMSFGGVPLSGVDENAMFAATDKGGDEPKVNYLWFILGIVIILAILKYASEHEKAAMEPKIVGVGVYNWVVVGILAMLFMLVTKTILNKYPIKGLTDIVNAS